MGTTAGTVFLGTCNMTNNVFIGMKGTVTQAGGATWNVKNNTAAGVASGEYVWGGTTSSGTFLNNVGFSGQQIGRCLGVNGSSYTADNNDWFLYSGQTATPVVAKGESFLNTWAQYQALVAPQDAHSFNTDPLFTNFPSNYINADDSLTWSNTPTKIFIPTTPQSYLAYLAVGDHIEIGWDGVMRTVQSIGSNFITFAPAKNDIVLSPIQGIANWKGNSNPAFDLTFKTGSKAIGGAQGGGNMGSTINVPAYMNGDFNGDGRRDIPAMPRR
jgi:hypothetical protein